MPKASFDEVGYSGLNRWGGTVFEELLPALQGPRAAKIYREMSENDPVIGGLLYAINQLVRGVTWDVEPAGTQPIDEEVADFVKSCMHDMDQPWVTFIEDAFSMLIFGWSWHEIVYKRRQGPPGSRYNDNRIGWRNLPGRAQETLYEWVFDAHGNVQALRQLAPPDFKVVTIPVEKSLHFRTTARKNNPEGRSILRNAYRPWYFKKRIEEIEGIGIERDLAGLPVLTPPEGVDIWNDKDPAAVSLRTRAENLVTHIRRDEYEGIVKPFGWTLELLSTQSRRQFDTNTIISRYDQRIAVTVLGDLILLGAGGVGSYALASTKLDLFISAIEGWLDVICDTFNKHAIPRLLELNTFVGYEEPPKLTHGKIAKPNLADLGRYLQSLTTSGAQFFPDATLENYLRALAGLPKMPPASTIAEPGLGLESQPMPPVGGIADGQNPEVGPTK